MNKKDFLSNLDKRLQKLTKEERQDILQDFSEHFEVGKAEGKTEEEIAHSLGSPSQIEKELLASYYVEKVESTSSAGNVLKAVWAVIGLSFFNLIIVLGPFIALVSLIVAGWISGGAFLLSPILFLVNLVAFPGTFEFFDMFFSLTLCGVGLLVLIGMLYVTRFSTKGLIKYLNYNVNLVKGGMKS
ncbi:HAAS signaling domain-containing protein [Gracilibacillus sp. D59]|uniref:HAAS signaling domain-containing protein n=1 Tax=Gracilibacillus sp. D59 TaxID=3457434 RepID=UPI003FCED897